MLEQVLADHYEDHRKGGFFMTSDDHETLIAREKPSVDGALPSGNAVAVMNLLRIGQFTADSRFYTRAEKVLASLSGLLNSNGSSAYKASIHTKAILCTQTPFLHRLSEVGSVWAKIGASVGCGKKLVDCMHSSPCRCILLDLSQRPILGFRVS